MKLGAALRAAMERADFKARRLAQQLGWSETELSRLLSGQINVSELDIVASPSTSTNSRCACRSVDRL